METLIRDCQIEILEWCDAASIFVLRMVSRTLYELLGSYPKPWQRPVRTAALKTGSIVLLDFLAGYGMGVRDKDLMLLDPDTFGVFRWILGKLDQPGGLRKAYQRLAKRCTKYEVILDAYKALQPKLELPRSKLWVRSGGLGDVTTLILFDRWPDNYQTLMPAEAAKNIPVLLGSPVALVITTTVGLTRVLAILVAQGRYDPTQVTNRALKYGHSELAEYLISTGSTTREEVIKLAHRAILDATKSSLSLLKGVVSVGGTIPADLFSLSHWSDVAVSTALYAAQHGAKPDTTGRILGNVPRCAAAKLQAAGFR